jgi:hypothetical protein
VDFTATYGNVINSPSWALVDKANNEYAFWTSYQKAVWDVQQYPPENYNNSYRNMLFRDGKVIQMPDQSKGSLSFDTIAGWVIEAPAFVMPDKPQGSAPPSCPILIVREAGRTFVLFHSPDGCLGARGSRQYNMFWQSGGTGQPSFQVDLKDIAVRVG